jgi:hypothetical protein
MTPSDFNTVDDACNALYGRYRGTNWDAWISSVWQTHETEYLALLASHGWTDAQYSAALQDSAVAALNTLMGSFRK